MCCVDPNAKPKPNSDPSTNPNPTLTPSCGMQGDWIDGKMEGMGSYQYADGSRYTGPWKDSKMHG